MANSRQNIRKLVKDGFVIRKPQKVRRAPAGPNVDFLSDPAALFKRSCTSRLTL